MLNSRARLSSCSYKVSKILFAVIFSGFIFHSCESNIQKEETNISRENIVVFTPSEPIQLISNKEILSSVLENTPDLGKGLVRVSNLISTEKAKMMAWANNAESKDYLSHENISGLQLLSVVSIVEVSNKDKNIGEYAENNLIYLQDSLLFYRNELLKLYFKECDVEVSEEFFDIVFTSNSDLEIERVNESMDQLLKDLSIEQKEKIKQMMNTMSIKETYINKYGRKQSFLETQFDQAPLAAGVAILEGIKSNFFFAFQPQSL